MLSRSLASTLCLSPFMSTASSQKRGSSSWGGGGKTSNSTKKNTKQLLSVDEKQRLWNVFDQDRKKIVLQQQLSTTTTTTTNNNNNTGSTPGAGCPRCIIGVLSVEDGGYPVCVNPDCAMLLRDVVDCGPEWRSFSSDTATDKGRDSARCGKPINPLLVESSFGCKILCGENASFEMKKIRKWTDWQSVPHREKSLYEEFQFITIMAQLGGITKKIIDDAMKIHKSISEQKMFRGLNRDGMKSASIYMACRLNGSPRTSHEIANIFHLDKTSATTGCSMAVNILHNIERGKDHDEKTEFASTKPVAFIERFCSPFGAFKANKELVDLCLFIANKIEEKAIIFDNAPHSIAAGILYFISQNCRLNIAKADIEHECKVSEVTINKCYKKMEEFKHLIMPSSILRKYQQQQPPPPPPPPTFL